LNSGNKAASGYRGNFGLIIILLFILGIIPVGFLYFGIREARKTEINNFRLNKSDVWDQTTKSYNRLLFDSIPSLSYYKGILDSNTFSPIAGRYFSDFPFLESIELYNLQIGIEARMGDISFKNLHFHPYSLIRYFRMGNQFLKRGDTTRQESLVNNSEFLSDGFRPLLNFSKLVSQFDSTRTLNSAELFKYFYEISDRKITYLSIPRNQEISLLRNWMDSKYLIPGAESNQNLLVFKLDPFKIPIQNYQPDLYEKILIRPLSFDTLSGNDNYYTTSITLPRAFSEYQLYFISSQSHIYSRAIRQFLPQLFVFLGIYALLALIGFLIFRNLSINNRLFKLQYDFINNFTHEFKTPVSVIKITGETLRGEGSLNPKELNIFGKILEEEADKLNTLINRLLSFTQLENKVVKVYYEDLNLPDFFNEILEEYRLKFPDFKIQYFAEDISLVKTDKVLLNSIFSNLMDNAYKYSYPDKKVLKIIVVRVKKWIVYRFIDQGIGIKKTEIEHIFNKFYKIENEFNVQGSVGIGLAFCKEVIGLMNGEIEVRSEEGKGTEFRVKLPDLR